MAIRIQRDHALAPLTTLEVGGSADVTCAETEGQVVEAIWYAQRGVCVDRSSGSNSLSLTRVGRGPHRRDGFRSARGDVVAVEAGRALG